MENSEHIRAVPVTLLLDASSLFSLCDARGSYPKTDGSGEKNISGLDILEAVASLPNVRVEVPEFIADFEARGGYAPEGEWLQLDRHIEHRKNFPLLDRFFRKIEEDKSPAEIVATDVDDQLFDALRAEPRVEGALQNYRRGEGNHGGDRALERLAFDSDGFTYFISEDGVFEDGVREGLFANKQGYPIGSVIAQSFVAELKDMRFTDLSTLFEEALEVEMTKQDIGNLFSLVGNQSRHDSGSSPLASARGEYTTKSGEVGASPKLSVALDGVKQLVSLPRTPEEEPVFVPRITKEGLQRPPIALPDGVLAREAQQRAEEEKEGFSAREVTREGEYTHHRVKERKMPSSWARNISGENSD
jgi:hypothetical protein